MGWTWCSGNCASLQLTLVQDELTPRGHSIECRVCAEDAAAGFLPQVGMVEVYREPSGPGVRLDTMLYRGWEVGADYDPLLGKLIVWGTDRGAAITRMAQAIGDYRILGVTTNLPFLYDVITHPAFASGDTTTAFIGEHFPEWHPRDAGIALQLAAALGLATHSATPVTTMAAAGNGEQPTPWQTLGAWSNT
jgi:acetyl/propionyl-CoA carboxylase alpha subunit